MNKEQPKTNEEIVEKILELSKDYKLLDYFNVSDGLLSAWHNFLSEKTVDALHKVAEAITLEDYITIFDEFIRNGMDKEAADFALFSYRTQNIPTDLGETLRYYALTEHSIDRQPDYHSSKIKEQMYVKYLFDDICCFHDIDFIQREYKVPGIGSIDILGKQIVTDRPVVIECKLGTKNPNKQLIAYGSHFDNPILIGITEEPMDEKYQLPNINYLTYYEMGIRVKGKEYDESNPPVYGIYAPENGWR